MAWWVTMLVALIGAGGGVAGGYLSGRLGSRATLQAVREERATRSRHDYLTALFAYRHAAALTLLIATEIPPEREQTRLDRWAFDKPLGVLGKLWRAFMSERESAVVEKQIPTVSWSFPMFRSTLTVALTGSETYRDSLLRRIDGFLSASARAHSLAPAAHIPLLEKIDTYVLATVEKPPAQAEAIRGWEPLRGELGELIGDVRQS